MIKSVLRLVAALAAILLAVTCIAGVMVVVWFYASLILTGSAAFLHGLIF